MMIGTLLVATTPAHAKWAVPGLRTSYGSVWTLGANDAAGFSFDAYLRWPGFLRYPAWKKKQHRIYLEPVVGYSYQDPDNATHLFAAGLDLAYDMGTSGLLALGVGVRGLVGRDTTGVTGGIRSVFALDIFFGILRIETGHQTLWPDGTAQHGITFMVGIGVDRLLALIFVGRVLGIVR